MASTLITGPKREPVTLDEMKDHLRVTITTDDALIDTYIQAAREWTEDFTRRAIVTQTWRLVLDEWPKTDFIELPRPPLQSVTSVKYYDADDTESTLSSDDYIVDTDSLPGRIVLRTDSSWPSGTLRAARGILIEYVAGYGNDPSDVPSYLQQAIRLVVGDFYENRESSIVGAVARPIPLAAERLLYSKRCFSF